MPINKIILSADIGKYDTKVVGRNFNSNDKELKKVCFRTKMYDLSKGYIDLEGLSYKIKFNDKEYIVGEQATDKSYDTSKTNILHKLCAYTAITQFIKPNCKNEIYMVLACPLSVLQIKQAKEEYKAFIKGSGEINIEVNGENFLFQIKEIMIKAEASGILYLKKELFLNNSVGIVDLGGLNMSFSLYENKVCKKENRFIEELGGNALISKVREKLTELKKGNIISDEAAEKALNKGFLPKNGTPDPASVKKIKEAKEEYFLDVLNKIKAYGHKVEDLDKLVFVGGTSQKVKECISKITHATLPENSNMVTVEGLYKVAYAKYSSIYKE